jgi:PKD repeat protein
MKNFLPFLLGFCLALEAASQNHYSCYTTEVMKKYFEENPSQKKIYDQFQEEAQKADELAAKSNYQAFRTATATYTIPVVFHILHLNGNENISDAQIQDAMYILNRDFRKQNADTSQIYADFKNLAADVNFEFRLATKDPSGKCTNGITRHYDPNTNWVSGNFSLYAYTWPVSKYLNIYVVNGIPGAAGYTYLPGTVPGVADVIVIRHDYVGSIGTANPYLSRALTHEVGHWFNLQHVWGMTNNPGVACGDDGVSDTPKTEGFNWCASISPAVCTPTIVENIQNYMEYAYCSRMFTIGQANRMTTCINGATAGRNNLWSNSNLIATGVINPVGPCAPIAEFKSNSDVVCVNGNVSFTDLSYNGTVSSWQWKLQGASSALNAVQNPTVTFISPGSKTVELRASNSFGADSINKNSVIVLAGTGSGTTNISQSFESIVFPDSFWITKPPQYGAGWIQTSTVAATGNKCVMVDNYFDSPNGPALFFTPMYDLTSLVSPGITFNVAYSQNAAGSNDRLRVYYSTDCASSWTPLYSKSGATLHTLGSGTVASGPFNSPTPSQWRKELVGMGSSFSLVASILFKFEFTPDSINPGNNIFLDDIEIENVTGIEELSREIPRISVCPNPSPGITSIRFDLKEKNIVKLEIFDLAGKLVVTDKPTELNAGDHKLNFNTSGLSQGLYLLRLSLGTGAVTVKLAVE